MNPPDLAALVDRHPDVSGPGRYDRRVSTSLDRLDLIALAVSIPLVLGTVFVVARRGRARRAASITTATREDS